MRKYLILLEYLEIILISIFLVPPTLRTVPQNGQVTARKGSTVSLECKASGNPVPTVHWSKKVYNK